MFHVVKLTVSGLGWTRKKTLLSLVKFCIFYYPPKISSDFYLEDIQLLDKKITLKPLTGEDNKNIEYR